MGEVGRAGVSIGSRWTSGFLIAGFCIWSPLRDLRGSCFLERLAFSDEFGQGVDACLCAKECCELVSGAPYSIMSPYSSRVRHSNTMCWRVCSPAPHGGFLYVVGLVVFAEVSVSSSSLCYYPWYASVECAECM